MSLASTLALRPSWFSSLTWQSWFIWGLFNLFGKVLRYQQVVLWIFQSCFGGLVIGFLLGGPYLACLLSFFPSFDASEEVLPNQSDGGFAPTIGLTIFLSLLPTVLMIIFRTFFSLKARQTLKQRKNWERQSWNQAEIMKQPVIFKQHSNKWRTELKSTAQSPLALQDLKIPMFQAKADAFSQHKLQAWYFLFQMVFVVLVTTVGKSVVSRFRALLEDPTSATEIMASSLPNATHFYMTYLVLQWTRHAMEMLRHSSLPLPSHVNSVVVERALSLVWRRKDANRRCLWMVVCFEDLSTQVSSRRPKQTCDWDTVCQCVCLLQWRLTSNNPRL